MLKVSLRPPDGEWSKTYAKGHYSFWTVFLIMLYNSIWHKRVKHTAAEGKNTLSLQTKFHKYYLLNEFVIHSSGHSPHASLKCIQLYISPGYMTMS